MIPGEDVHNLPKVEHCGNTPRASLDAVGDLHVGEDPVRRRHRLEVSGRHHGAGGNVLCCERKGAGHGEEQGSHNGKADDP